MPLTLRGFGAYISCDGEEVEQFGAKVENDKTTVCFIASEEGKVRCKHSSVGNSMTKSSQEFAVHWIDQKPPTNLSIEVKMDGRRMGVLSQQKQAEGRNSGFRVALDLHRPYVFSSLELHGTSPAPKPTLQVNPSFHV